MYSVCLKMGTSGHYSSRSWHFDVQPALCIDFFFFIYFFFFWGGEGGGGGEKDKICKKNPVFRKRKKKDK